MILRDVPKVLARVRELAYHSDMEILTDEDVRDELRKACEEAGSQSAWAKKHGVGCSYVSDVLTGRRGPGPAILAALGCELAGYRRVKANSGRQGWK